MCFRSAPSSSSTYPRAAVLPRETASSASRTVVPWTVVGGTLRCRWRLGVKTTRGMGITSAGIYFAEYGEGSRRSRRLEEVVILVRLGEAELRIQLLRRFIVDADLETAGRSAALPPPLQGGRHHLP